MRRSHRGEDARQFTRLVASWLIVERETATNREPRCGVPCLDVARPTEKTIRARDPRTQSVGFKGFMSGVTPGEADMEMSEFQS